MRMIIADDEPIIIRGIQKLVDWNSLGIEIVGEYKDGKKALEGIIREKPDLALLDISMPGMTGIEILKECRALGCQTQIIFISGFQDFEYAQSAVKYGAADYLLKPVIKDELLNAVEKCLVGIGEKKQQEETEEGQKEADYSKLIEVEDTCYVPVYAEVLYNPDENEQMKKLIRFSFISFLEEYLEKEQIGITFTKKENIALVLKGLNIEECKRVVEEMQRAAMLATSHFVMFIIGNEVRSMGEIPVAFELCMGMKRYSFFASYMKRGVFTVSEAVFVNLGDAERMTELRERVLDTVVAQDFGNFEQLFEKFVRMLCRVSDGRKEDAAFYFCNAIRLMEEKVLNLHLAGLKPEMKLLLEEGRDAGNYEKMVERYRLVFEEYLNLIQKSVASHDKKDIQKAKEYIEKHYKENLTLTVLAEEIHMNPYYFSSFFKKNAGENFKDYVNRVRIQHATSLLLSTDMKTYEIANEVGFSDARAFSDVFQRIYHETPSSYRKRVSAQEEKR
ncbi:response regulator transcription factor [Konateibacter massiliensis]|uniref:response regulator transcription factor n=1 Tax=Konateibacter massiliensis TaxID=2002841 RepID=UPI000C1605BD|nr:response regulator [Konateibacter massiliensis]